MSKIESKWSNPTGLFALVGLLFVGLLPANVAVAADEEVAIEEVVVTGSRIKRTGLETASPISVFTSADIEASGLTTIEDFIQNIPSVNGAYVGASINNGNPGLATAGLRGLGSGRTLTLINGRRFNSGDLNSIPTSFVERVEVVRDGASTIYGSDAIAGVINFITKTDFEGMDVNLQYDVTGEGDGETSKFSVVTGASSDRGNVVVSVDYVNRIAIGQGDRSYSECPIWEQSDGTKYCGGSSHSHFGRVNVPAVNGLGLDAGRYVVIDGQAVPFSTADHGFNYAALSYLVTPQEVFTMNAASRYDITDNIRLIAEAGYASRQSDQLMAPVATFWSAPMPAAHPNNIFGVDVSVNRRLTETGGRNFTQDANDYRLVTGLEGSFENGWDWDVSYNYSRFIDARVITGQINRPRMETLLDPTLCAADDECPGIWNPTAQNTLTAEQIAYASVTHSPVRRGTTTQLMANLSGDFGSFEIAGPIRWAAGVERRTESYLFQPDGAAAPGQIYFVSGEKTEGSYRVDEAYFEINVPLFEDAPLAERFDLTAAIRSSDYSNLNDTTTNSKFGLEWEPGAGFLIRSTWAEGFRAPSITELYAPQRQSANSYTDPCWDWGNSDNANVRANCAADGLPQNFTSDTQTAAVLGGNPDLTAEESKTFTIGVAYTGVENLTISLDYFDIEITDGVGTAGTDNVAHGCYESANFSSPMCDLIKGHSYGPIDTPPHPTSPRRNVNGIISGILLTKANLATFETRGIDYSVTYSMDVANGNLIASLNGAWLDKYDYLPLAGGQWVRAAGYVAEDQWEDQPAVFAEHKTNLGLTYTADNYSVNSTLRYHSGGDDINATAATHDAVADAIVYLDVQGTYNFSNYSATAGVRNLMDETPPYMSNYDDMNTINASYDLAGRYLYFKLRAEF